MARRTVDLCIVALALAALPAAASAHGRSDVQRFIVLGEATDPPRGFIDMCAADAQLCASFAPPAPGFAKPVANREPSTARTAWEASASALPSLDIALVHIAAPAYPEAANGLAFMAGPTLKPASPPGLDLPIALSVSPKSDPACGAFAFSPAPRCVAPAMPSLAEVAAQLQLALPEATQVLSRHASFALETAAILPVSVQTGPPAATPELAKAIPTADDRAILRQLDRVNAHVNARVHQQSDLATFGAPEVWRPSGDGARAVGDCEDLALEKRVELLRDHFPAERLFLAVVYRSDFGLHTVLVARLAGGDVVLDSRVNFIEPWSRTGYSWLSVETPGKPQEWHEVA